MHSEPNSPSRNAEPQATSENTPPENPPTEAASTHTTGNGPGQRVASPAPPAGRRPPRGGRRLDAIAAVGLAVGFGVLGLAAGGLSTGIGRTVLQRMHPDLPPTAPFAQPWLAPFLNHTGFLIFSFLLMLFLGRGNLARFGFRMPKRFDIRPPLLLMAAIALLATVLGIVLPGPGLAMIERMNVLQVIVFVWFYASIAEEILTRGLIQGFLEPYGDMGLVLPLVAARKRSRAPGHPNAVSGKAAGGSVKLEQRRPLFLSLPVLVSGIFFGAMHLMLLTVGVAPAQVGVIFFFTLAGGILAAYYREKTGSLIPAIGIHASANIFGTIFGILIGTLLGFEPHGSPEARPAGRVAEFVVVSGEVVPQGHQIVLGPQEGGRLQALIDSLGNKLLRITLRPGHYHLKARPYVDPTCGNCEDPARPVEATLGLYVHGRGIVLEGAGTEQTVIHTHAGYGLLVEDCRECLIRNLTITGGVRDPAPEATDAAIVVRRSHVRIERCKIAENRGDSALVAKTVVGVMGICGREGSRLEVVGCEILGNSWDGIALYRDASASVRECRIDGLESGRGSPNAGGRGAGIGITWNAKAEVIGNLVTRYWKGIGIFVDAQATVRENIVEDVLTWGITLWDAGKGRPWADIAWNAVYRTGACGIAVTRELSGGRTASKVTRNAIALTGGNPRYDSPDYYCPQEALAVMASTPDLLVTENAFFQNREPPGEGTCQQPEGCPGKNDMSRERFLTATNTLRERLHAHQVLSRSHFLADFGPPDDRIPH